MLRATNIEKSYDDLKVLRGISLDIQESTITSIVGKSGSGKSTLLHILGTLDSPDSGHIEFGGQVISHLSDKELALFRNSSIGFVFQFHHLIPEFNALENVCIPGHIGNVKKSKVTAKAKELLDYLGLSERFHHKPSELSGGEQQRVAVARALINEPKLVFADEPTGNLDTSTSEELHQLILDLKKDMGQTFIIVTHNEELAKLSDTCLEIQDGLLVT
ncbi:ABC transporter ATP-binding protein [Saprospiraceae bacterium]|nr:ABC transporter ATP-binding protein [Saprospiraceae bacterium]